MNTIVFDDRLLIPVNKIVLATIDDQDNKKVVIWLDGWFVQRITCPSEEEAINTFNTIKKEIKSL